MYSIIEAVGEREAEVINAINTRDSEALYTLAGLYKEEGEDEMADTLRAEAKKIDREDDSFDQFRDNQL